ncbi:unnamed protein product, partial [Ectocarpus sp. 12 AP-2014]
SNLRGLACWPCRPRCSSSKVSSNRFASLIHAYKQASAGRGVLYRKCLARNPGGFHLKRLDEQLLPARQHAAVRCREAIGESHRVPSCTLAHLVGTIQKHY